MKNIVRELRIQDDLRCRAVEELAIKSDIPYRDAEKIVDARMEKAERILEEVALC